MHYPVMTQYQVATRLKIAVKTIRRWRQENIGPIWHKLFHYARYYEADIFEFERQGAQHWLNIHDKGDSLCRVYEQSPTPADGSDSEVKKSLIQYLTANEISQVTQLPGYIFSDRQQRKRRKIPHLLAGCGCVRFSLNAVWQWELANSVVGTAKQPNPPVTRIESEPESPPSPIPRWYDLVPSNTTQALSRPLTCTSITQPCSTLPSCSDEEIPCRSP
jgi:transcriptional regulator with XRE-family HTH domain